MFVGVVALRYFKTQNLCCVVLITECHNSHKHSQSPLANSLVMMNMLDLCTHALCRVDNS